MRNILRSTNAKAVSSTLMAAVVWSDLLGWASPPIPSQRQWKDQLMAVQRNPLQ